MNLQQLQYFKVVAKFQHMTKASNYLHIAQPALSKTVKMLEDELQVSLFDRIGKNIYINENGRILLNYTYTIERELQQMEEEVANKKQKLNQMITILMKATPMLVVPLLQDFRIQHPEVTVKLLTYNQHINETNVKYDFWLEDCIFAKPDPRCIVLHQEEIVLAVGVNHPWAGCEIDFADAAGMSFVSIPTSQAKGKDFLQICKMHGFRPKIVLESSDLYTLQEMVESGVGIALVPEYSWGILNNPRISYAKLKGQKEWNTIRMRKSDSCGNSQAVNDFWNYLTQRVDKTLRLF